MEFFSINKGWHLHLYIFNSFYSEYASCEHAMLKNGASVEISRYKVTRCLFWRDVAIHLSFSNFLCDWPSVDPDLSTTSYDQKDLCVFCRTYTSPWSRWQQNWLDLSNGQVRRQSLQSVHDITGSFTSCYKSHRLQTRLFLFIPCGILSWLPVSFLLHIKYTLSYRIVQNIVLSTRLLVVVQSSSITK